MAKSKKPSPTKVRSKSLKERAEAPATLPVEAAPANLSGLSAAAQVLRAAGEPLRVRVLVERMMEQRLWASEGKTPAATIAAGMLREIATKGVGSRFTKAGRGLFALSGA